MLGHPRNPYHRVDALAGSRHVVVSLGGHTLAESTRPLVLFETGEPTRFYLAQADVRRDLLEPSETVTLFRRTWAPPSGSRRGSTAPRTPTSPGRTASRSRRCRASQACWRFGTSSCASASARSRAPSLTLDALPCMVNHLVN